MSNQGAVSIVGFPTAPGSHCPGPSSDSEPTPSLQSGLDGLGLAWDTEWEVPDPQQRAMCLPTALTIGQDSWSTCGQWRPTLPSLLCPPKRDAHSSGP